MADINITGLQVAGDDVFISGTVDEVETKAHTWLSHLYPPKSQDADSAKRGCQTDDERKNHLSDVLLEAAGQGPKQELAQKILDALTVLITTSEKPPVVVDPT